MTDQDDKHSTLLRSVRVLLGLAESGQAMTVTRLAQALGLPPSTTHRILNVLLKAGYVMQNEETGTYGPGMGFLRVSTMLAAASPLASSIQAVLNDLVERSGESAFYGAYLRETGRMRFVSVLHSHHAIQYVLRGNRTYSLLWGASGRAIAASLPQRQVRVLFEREKDSAEGVAPLPDWASFWQELCDIRSAGYALSDGQRHDGSHAIAAPVIGAQDTLLGCVGLAMPASRRQARSTRQTIELVTAAAAQLSMAGRFAQAGTGPSFSS
jgi:DNA-binding IclR family transcriptional regulator